MRPIRRLLERVFTVALLTACGETLPATSDDASPPDGGADASTADGGVDALDASVDGAPSSSCEADSSVVVPTGCAPPNSNAQQQFIACSTFDDDAQPVNAPFQSNGSASVTAEAISPPNGVTIKTAQGISQVVVSSEVGPVVFDKGVLEADVRLEKLGTRFVLGELTVSQTIGGTQVLELWVEEDGTLSAAASLSNAGFADAGASAVGAMLCPNRWSHVRFAVQFKPSSSTVDVDVSIDATSAKATFPSHIAPDPNESTAVGYVGVRTVELGSKAVKLDVDNVQLYVH